MTTVTIDDRQIQRRLKHLEEALGPSHLPRVLGDIGEQIIERTRINVKAGHDWQGRPFAPNKESTLKRKRGAQPLIDSGVFLASRLFYHVGASSLTIGANGVQAAVLQFGASKGQFGTGKTRRFVIPWGTIPPRPYLPLTDDGTGLVSAAREEVLTIIEEYIDSAAKA